MISQEDNKLIDIKFIDNRDMKYAYYKRSYFSKFFGGKLKTFKQSITRVKLTKNYLLSFRIKSSSLSNRSQI